MSDYEHLVAQWHPTKNEGLTPDQVTYGSGKGIWWKCSEGRDHVWQASPATRIGQGRGCPYCAHQRLSRSNCLSTLAPRVAAEWHPTKNGDLTPRQVIAGSGKKRWWRCPEGHPYQQSPSRRVYEGHGCPGCAGVSVRRDTSLARACPPVAGQWHPTRNGELRPRDVHVGSTLKAWWKCAGGPDHEWQALVRARTRMGHGCPYCANRKPSVTNRLDVLFPEIAAEWHPTKNGKLTADQVVDSTKARAWWRCQKHQRHVWQARVVDRTVRGAGCPECRGSSK